MINSPWQHKFRTAGVTLAVLFHVVVLVAVFNVPELHKGGFGFMLYWYMPAIFFGLPWSFVAMFVPAELFSLLGIAGAVCLNGYLIGWVLDALANNVPTVRRKRRLTDEELQKALSDDPAALTPNQVESLAEFIEDAGGIENARLMVHAR
ncbi:MAG: hypothetical protein ACR2NU_11295 [Aeoliella sp.]